MSIALFDDPLRVSLAADMGLSREGLLVGLADDLMGVVMQEDGSLTFVHPSHFTIQWRYNAETDRWADINTREPDQSNQLE